MKKYKKLLVVIAFALTSNVLSADEDLAKQSQNPVGSLYSVPVEYWHHKGIGPDGEGAANLAFMKPVIPVEIGKVNLINRFIIPYVGIDPHSGGDFGNVILPSSPTKSSGLGNMQYQPILSAAEPGNVIYGLGGIFEFPTHSGNLGSDNYSAGPTFVALSMPGNWVVGTLIQNTWSIGGSSNPNDEVNSLLWQYFINYNLDNGWYLTSTPIMTADWTAESGEQWTVPVGGGVGKLMKFESFPPLDFKLQVFKSVVKPSNGADWQAMFAIKMILPKALFNGRMNK